MKAKKFLVVALILVMCFTTLLAGCGKSNDSNTLVVGYSYFNSRFSAFFAQTAYDQDVAGMTGLSLLSFDRKGEVVTKGIEGETRAYNGTDYTYYGPADVVMTENEDGSVYFDFTLRDDLKFSDGEKITIDDVIFSLYVLLDPTYDGSSTLYALPIKGIDEYRAGMGQRGAEIFKAGQAGYVATDLYTEEQYNKFWEYYNGQAKVDFAQEIVDYCMANYASYGAVDVASSAALWGFDLAEGATAADFANAIGEAYGNDWATAESVETAGSDLLGLTIAADSEFQAGVQTGDSAKTVEGIQKTGEYSMRIVLTEVDATWYTQFSITICPLHYYGSDALFDYENGQFGFVKGDLSSVKAKTTQPMGAGPYKFISFENGVVRFEANKNYYLGKPATKYINFLESSDAEKVNGVITGTIDITDPSISNDVVNTIKGQNSNGELTGDKIATSLVDNLGYGYIGINAYNVNVNGVAGSEASKNLRKALATVFSVYRDLAIDSYYGERAAVINYPISNTSWAAPQATDDGYAIAFSKDVDGNEIYTSEMTAEERYAAALQAALGYFKAAGYTVSNGKVVAAPKGGKMEFTALIPGDGIGDHPSFMIFSEAKKALESIGIKFNVNDLSNSSDLWDKLDNVSVDIWAAAWGATIDPDMYQIYYADVENATGTRKAQYNPYGGPQQGGSSYEYCIADSELDKLIMQGRKTSDTAARKVIYKAALDIVVDWACEVPVYQRQNAIIFNSQTVNLDTVTPDITTFYGWLAEVQNIELK